MYFILDITVMEINRAKDIKKVGATGAYTKEFDEIQDQLDEIEILLNKTSTVDLVSIDDNLDKLRDLINETEMDTLKSLNDILGEAEQGKNLAEITLQNLEADTNALRDKIQQLENNATDLQEGNVQGALDIVRKAKANAGNAMESARKTEVILYIYICVCVCVCVYDYIFQHLKINLIVSLKYEYIFMLTF